MTEASGASASIAELTADIVPSYVANNSTPYADLATLIWAVHGALTAASSAPEIVPTEASEPKAIPAMIRKSITPDALISFLDVKPYKMLRRHLATHGHTPQSYREHFGLQTNYPMVAQNRSARRSQLAKRIGLGAQRKGARLTKASPIPRAKRGA